MIARYFEVALLHFRGHREKWNKWMGYCQHIFDLHIEWANYAFNPTEQPEPEPEPFPAVMCRDFSAYRDDQTCLTFQCPICVAETMNTQAVCDGCGEAR